MFDLLEQEEGGIQLPVEQVKNEDAIVMIMVMIMARMMITMILVKH